MVTAFMLACFAGDNEIMALPPGNYEYAQEMAFLEASQRLYDRLSQHYGDADCVKEMNRLMRSAYGENPPATFILQGSVCMIALAGNRRAFKLIDSGSGGNGSNRNGDSEDDDSNEPPGPQWWAIVLVLAVLLYGYAIWRFLRWVFL